MLLIGSRIQEYRKKAGLNQEEFAEKMGVSRQAVSKWERDKAYPDLDRLVCICEILDVQVGELIYGKGDEPEAPEEVSGDGTSTNNAVHLKNLRGKGRLARLKILFCVMAAICVFCVIVVAVLFVRNEWISHSDKNGNVRVEKVYQQYTKADLAYLDDNGRKIMDTVWLDVPGIRDGDYIQLYTGADGDGLFLNYKTSTIVAASFVMLVFIILLILIGLEIRRMKKEDTLQIILEDKTAYGPAKSGPFLSTTNKLVKSTLPSNRPIGGIMISLTRESTIFPKAAPMIIPTAISITLPRMANFLNSLKKFLNILPPFLMMKSI